MAGTGSGRGIGACRNWRSRTGSDTGGKNKALTYLESTEKGVLDAMKGLSEAQWTFKPAPDKWSVAEGIEQIAAAEDFLRRMAVENVMEAPPAPGRDTAKIDSDIVGTIPDRSQKV